MNRLVKSSVQTHTREEWNRAELRRTEEPLMILLEYTFAADSMLCQNSIQTGFGGVRLPTTIEKFNPSFTNSGDQIAVKKHIGDVGTCHDFGVIKFEIFASGDSGIHQAFDLSHGSQLGERLGVGGSLPPTSIVWHPRGGLWGIGGQFSDRHHALGRAKFA